MDWINEMRNSQPSEAKRRKISDYRYYHRHKEERAEANRKWRREHAEQYAKKQKEYHSRPKTLKNKRETARFHAMTPEQKAEYIREQNERARIRRAKAKAAKETKESK